MKLNLEVNLGALEATLERQIVRVRREAKRICLEEAQAIMDESLKEVPRDTGALAESAFIEQDSDGNVTFGYGGDHVQTNAKSQKLTNQYMIAVHERLDIKHWNGKAKFLEDPVNRHKALLELSFAQKLRRAFRRG